MLIFTIGDVLGLAFIAIVAVIVLVKNFNK